MNIIQTLSTSKNKSILQEELKFLYKKNIYGIRFNLCKFRFEELEQVLSNIQESISMYEEYFELFFDIPYPKNKARIRDFSIKMVLLK